MLDLRPLRSADFRHLATAYWINEFGTWIGEIALTILVYDRTHSPLATAGLFLTLRFLPALFAQPLTTRVEAMRTRRVLPALYTVEAALYTAIAVSVAGGQSMAVILVLAAVDAALAIAAKTLNRTATVNGLVKRQLLREGNALVNLGWMASGACAPLIAGALVAWQGMETALLVDAASFLITALFVVTAAGIHVESDTDVGFRERLNKGLSLLRQTGPIQRLTVALALVMLLSALPLPIEVVFAIRTLHASDTGYGLLIGSWGIGMVVGGIIFASMPDPRLTSVFGLGFLIVAVGYGVLAASPTLAIACAGSALGGTGNGAGWVAALTSLQSRIPIRRQSAVMAVLEGLNQVMPAIGFAAGGAITEATSPRVAYAVSAVGVGLAMLIFMIRPIDRVELGPASPSRPGEPEPQETDALSRTRSITSLTIG